MAALHTDVLIIGGGASAAMLTANLVRLSAGHPPAQRPHITVADPAQHIGPGLAYAQCTAQQLLNVPAANMSAHAHDTQHFLRHCQSLNPHTTGADFMPRQLYGQYLHTLWEQACRTHGAPLVHRRTLVNQLERSGNGWCATCADGSRILASAVVLATGHEAPSLPSANAVPKIPQPRPKLPNGTVGGRGCPHAAASAPIIAAWDFEAMQQLPDDAHVLIIGSGHTAVDALLHLCHEPPGLRRVHLVSRHGLLPHAHRAHAAQTLTAAQSLALITALRQAPPTVPARLTALRGQLAAFTAQGLDWRDVLTALRGHTAQLWQDWPAAERRRFLRHLAARWDVCRHRLAPEVAEAMQALLAAGRLTHEAARVAQIQPLVNARGRPALQIQLYPRGGHFPIFRQFDALIVCTGPHSDIRTSEHTLLRQLLAAGHISADALGLGLRVDAATLAPLNKHGQSSQALWYLGPLLKATLWEATAIPELRGHAATIAAQVLTQLLTSANRTQ